MNDEQRGQGRPDGAGEPSEPRIQQPSMHDAGRPSGQPGDQAAQWPYGAGPYGTPWVGQQPPYAPLGSAGGGPGHRTATLPADPPRRRRPMVGIVAAALIAGLVGGGAGFGGAYALLDHNQGGARPALTATPAGGTSTPAPDGTVAAAAATALPSTVDILVPMSQGTAEGSGVILTADGAVLTNNHVVAGAAGPIAVTLADGSKHSATVVGTSPSYDLAVIKLDGASGLTPATLGRSQDVKVGQQVVAIGSPQGLSGTVTTGIVSALNRTVSVQGQNGSGVVYNGLQTDAPINQGNSGGPLVNLEGQVIGINSAIATASQSTGSIGLGFAIPVDQARRVAQEILDTGKATKPVLGVEGSTAPSIRNSSTAGGATIQQVQNGSPAAAAGLKAGDVVTKVDDGGVNDFADLVARIGSYAPGDKVTLTVASGGSTRTVEVTLAGVADQAPTTSSGRSLPDRGAPFGGLSPFGDN
ncbi:S1C family serine protease [Pseudonocardia hispaniensis]|uniref:S1C family serine protease n=1 Tax=Pseudonocardia hispaniensis TaxID=904933 RepID=A0ABW1J673_9PSEU